MCSPLLCDPGPDYRPGFHSLSVMAYSQMSALIHVHVTSASETHAGDKHGLWIEAIRVPTYFTLFHHCVDLYYLSCFKDAVRDLTNYSLLTHTGKNLNFRMTHDH